MTQHANAGTPAVLDLSVSNERPAGGLRRGRPGLGRSARRCRRLPRHVDFAAPEHRERHAGNLPIVLPSRVRKIRVKLSSSRRLFSSSYTTTTLPSLLVFVFGLGGVAARAGVPAVCGFAGSACKVIVAPATGLPSCVIVTSDFTHHCLRCRGQQKHAQGSRNH